MNITKPCRYGEMIINDKDIWVGNSLKKYGEFSESEVSLFRQVIKPGMVVTDVGANVGAHSLAFARLVGPAGSVFAFEPERLNFYTLCGNTALNNLNNIYCFHQAVGQTRKVVYVPEIKPETVGNYGSLSLLDDHSKSDCYPVQMISLDSLNLYQLNFLKLDIEGMEKEALEGAAFAIAKHKPYLYVEDDKVERHDELVYFIKSKGYVVYKHLANLFNPDNFHKDPENIFVGTTEDGIGCDIVSVNLFCYHQSHPCPINPVDFKMELL